MAHSNKPVVRTPGQRSVVDPVLSLAVLAAFLAIPATSFADTRGGGETTSGNVTLNNAVDESTDVWEELRSETFTLTTASNIIVTACSDVSNPGGAISNTYHFVIALDDTSPGLDTGAERTLDELYDDPGEDDPDAVHVCSTRFFANVAPGAHTIFWLGSKASGAMANTTVLDTSMTVGAFSGSEL
jgi:hypothetical protein